MDNVFLETRLTLQKLAPCPKQIVAILHGQRNTRLEAVGVPNREGQTRYAVKVIRCRTDQGDPAALLVITDLLSSVHVSREAVAKVFNLSDREAEFAELFSSGLRIDAIATRMGIALNTARVHLRNVFAKTGCASQIELARTFAHIP